MPAQESVAQDLTKILYQVLTRLYRDLVRPGMGGAKPVVDDFDWDRVYESLSRMVSGEKSLSNNIFTISINVCAVIR